MQHKVFHSMLLILNTSSKQVLIFMIINCNCFRSPNILNGTHFGLRAELNIILNPDAFHNNLSKSNGTLLYSGFWLFIFQNNDFKSQNEIISQMRDFFELLLPSIQLNSQIYVIQPLQSVVLYEIYRKSSCMNVTINALYKSDLLTNEMVVLAEKRIWTRRKDLTGVHFKVGYVQNHLFINEKNKVTDIKI